MQVGTTKNQGLYNKPSAAVHPEALPTRTVPQNNTKTILRGIGPGLILWLGLWTGEGHL